jgi:hypothetical protein
MGITIRYKGKAKSLGAIDGLIDPRKPFIKNYLDR